LVLTGSVLYQADSPRGSIRLVATGCGFDCIFHLEASRWWGWKEIARGNDCTFSTAQTAWVGSVAVVYVDGGACPDMKIAHDFQTGENVNFEQYESALYSAPASP
jgi:hypothetical protein